MSRKEELSAVPTTPDPVRPGEQEGVQEDFRGISLSVPESWWEFDIRPEGRDGTIRALVDERIREVPDPADYRAELTARGSVDRATPCFFRVPSTDNLPEVGPAARTFGVEDVPVAQGDTRTLRMVLTQTYIPVPGTAGQVVLVSGASPVLDLAEAFHDVFDAVTGTFRFV
ncbi:hypothetical protein [Streptomyces sp. 142MFCol3.1]|uniref:hypothetical protein n=1 Tax=Streptomyces sp. 142MFCol3.1 TaxID=1172179 RepID=UPI0004066961|nr:hypothetical protein [Streptomyces sp. 142MFCol3.1]